MEITNDLEIHDAVVTQLESDILECKVKWTLGSITMNKASGGDKIPTELFIILKDDVVKGCTQYVHKFENLGSGHGTRKGQFSLQSQRRAMKRMFKLLHSCAHSTCKFLLNIL